MKVLELITMLEAEGVRLWEDAGQLRFRAPRGVLTDGKLAALRERKAAVLDFLRGAALSVAPLLPEPAHRYDPFPVTDVQSAYLLGRRDSFAYGGVACHAYGELAMPAVDVPRLEAAWRTLVERHDMLRAVVEADGSQRVLREVPPYRIAVLDHRGDDPRNVQAAIEAVRAELDHQMTPPNRWPLFELRVTLFDGGARLHVSLDFLVADYVSLQVLLDELRTLYHDPDQPLSPLTITFRDYLLAERGLRASRRYERDRAYWWRRLATLPSAPELPLRAPDVAPSAGRFCRRAFSLESSAWASLRERAGREGITASTALLAAYAEAVGRWSRHPRFTLDVTVLQRLPLHPEVERLVGDFTSTILLAVDPPPSATFAERARALQTQLWDDMDHRLCSGIEVAREIVRRSGPRAALMPIVFTSAVGLVPHPRAGKLPLPLLGTLVYGISQTPQVWIDCQVMENGEVLEVNWDHRLGVFPAGLVEDMFGAFEALVRSLAVEDAPWSAVSPIALPEPQRERRRRANATQGPVPHELLQAGFLSQASSAPERLAIVGGGRALSYGTLLDEATAVAQALRGAGCAGGEVVAVVLDKGAAQVVAVLGVLLAGAAYLPIDTDQPAVRRALMLDTAGARLVLTHRCLAGDTAWPAGTRCIATDVPLPKALPTMRATTEARSDELAYVIYTSGSTGAPKGVMITHRSAVNTIADINRRFAVGPHDRVLGLASLGFDLSVYDIFGPLAVGGCIVLPDHDRRRDPSHWAELLSMHDVTLWNSVPAQIQMLSEYLRTDPTSDLPALRLAMLSGDWIPVALPTQLHRQLPGIEVVSLGGATEAAIWSIAYPIDEVPPTWTSIPYGTPLTNQRFYVLDAQRRDCPDWTAGELHIGGAGLAVGYLGDPELTAARFVTHPATGERLYRTGDLGRYLPDGNIEFLGREDSQVKLRGHRIELGELETALASHPGIAGAAAIVAGESPSERRLSAFVETAHVPLDRVAVDTDAARVREAAAAAAREIRAGVDCERVVRFAQQLDRTALLSMLHALRQQGLFGTSAEAHTLDAILTHCRVAPRHHRLLRRWLNALQTNELLCRDPHTGAYHGAVPVDEEMVKTAWSLARALQPDVDRRTELLDYFYLASQHLRELMRGELDPVGLLFPQGGVEIHLVAYHDSFLGRYLNRLLTAAVCEVAATHRAAAPLRLLEVGAGVGGTSLDLIPALRSFGVSYHFTDVSQFFLNRARERFGDDPRVTYGLFDMNADYRAQSLPPNHFDVVVCANVLHYARDAAEVLGRLRELLVPGGWLVFIEMVRDNYQVLTSMEFLFDESVGDFRDVRRGRDATFIDLAQWHAILGAAGARTALCAPAPDDVLASIGFHVFAAQFKIDRARISPEALQTHLADRLPAYMLPAHIQIVDALPLTDNGKVDRTMLRKWLLPETSLSQTILDEPTNDLEGRLAAVWASVLGVRHVGRDQDFFELGGDSLLAAQLVGRLREAMPEASAMYFDELLRCVLEGPTVRRLATRLLESHAAAPPAVDAPAPASTSLVCLGGESGATTHVLLHDAGGTLRAYDALREHLGSRGRVLGFIVDDAKAYLDLPAHVLVASTAAKYAELLRPEHASDIHLVGHDFGGILAAEVARHLAERGTPVARLTITGVLPPGKAALQAPLLEYLQLRWGDVEPERAGFPMEDERPLLARWASRHTGERVAALGTALYPEVEAGEAVRRVETQLALIWHSLDAAVQHEVEPYTGDIVLLLPREDVPLWPDARAWTLAFWRERCLGDLIVHVLDGDPFTCLHGPGAAQAAAPLLDTLTC
jgi:pyochelin synthetase